MKPESESNAVATWALLQPQGQRRVFFPMGGATVVDLFPTPEPHGWGFKDDPRPDLSFVAGLSTRRLYILLDMLDYNRLLLDNASEKRAVLTYKHTLRSLGKEHRLDLSDAQKLHDFCTAHRIPVPPWDDNFEYENRHFDTTAILEAQQSERDALTSRLALEAALSRPGLPAPVATRSRL